MPLLKRKAKLEKSTASEYLRDDDEVFHCEVTDEIFKDYEEYCERIILVNSMVWSCEMTGKNNLTYAEALDSEKAARRSLKDFPMELRIPILYLAAKTKRCSFAEMAEDVFNYVRERYFVGESVEACLEGENWRESHVLSVTAPKQQPGSKVTLPASAYCYEVEQFESSSSGQVVVAAHDRVRRRKGVFSRDKCRLFLKQFVEMENTVIVIKKAALEKYNIGKVNFEQIFTGSPPDFPSSKRLMKTSISPAKGQPKPGSASKAKPAKKPSPEKKGQQSMDKFVKKSDKADAPKPKPDPAAKKSGQDLADKMRRAEEQMKQRREDEKAKKKEKNARLQAYLKEWQKVKDDLLLEDHKIIPKGTPVVIEGIDSKHIGDFLSVLEFVHLYAETLKTKEFFHNGLDIETFRKALTAKEYASCFSDLIQMMLQTIFSLQEDEAEEYNEGGSIDVSNGLDEEAPSAELDMNRAVELATKASKWPQTYLGTPLSKLPMDPTTVSEVLRLHLLSSGAAAGSRCAAWRYQQRGGYSARDEPALQLRRHNPRPLLALRAAHVTALPLEDKFTILQCLQNQILSYATVRDIVEEKLENYKAMKHELRMSHIQERKREAELLVAKAKLKKEAAAKKEEQKLTGDKAKAVDLELTRAIEKLTKEGEDKKAQYVKKSNQLQKDCFEYVSYLGSDRAYRRYWLNQCVAGLFVEAGAEPRGPCLDKPVLPAPPDEDTLTYVTKLFESDKERGGSDKENDSGANSRGNSPKKPLAHLNGLTQKLSGLESNLQHMKELLMCTGDISTCYPHGSASRPQWWVLHSPEQVSALMTSLNKRGAREAELRHSLEVDLPRLLHYVKDAPLSALNPSVAPPPPVAPTRRNKFQPSLVVPPDCSVREALELSLRDYILELEEKIFHGCLGAVQVKDREAWRGTIMLRGYDKQANYLSWGPRKQFRDDCHLPNGVFKMPAEVDPSNPIPENKYRDPGHYLSDRVNGVKLEPDTVKTEAPAGGVVRGLASALLQVEQGIHHKYLKRPLGLDDKERKEREAKGKSLDMEALERWEVSLMECQSFAQICLHLFTLDSSVSWSASILNASCKICRRKTDPDNMLLCDHCNKGHHLYCLKPKLTKVPEGDWFCAQCKPKEQKTPRKRRKIFSDEELEEAMHEDSDSESESPAVCGTCGSGGELAAACSSCRAPHHAECLPPRASRRALCKQCTPARERRRCAETAITNIHEYTRALNAPRHDTSESDDSEDNTALVRLKTTRKSRNSKEPSPMVNGHSTTKKSRKSKEETNTSSRKSRTSGATTPVMNGHHEERKSSRRSSKGAASQPALHAPALQQLLKELLKHKDSWPFAEPVDVEEVPDYLSIISTPMDLSTMQGKLASGGYESDAQFVADAALVFRNCYTYNRDTHPVARSAVRLEKYFNKRAAELELPTLPEMNFDEEAEAEVEAGSKRSSSEEPPTAKRVKTK
ncbi:bromodomain adjacent to zinc finger domain protein 1A [Plutella xylostella]|uniref:bromodomain adjacent to zinc finger domain protein 1A n=1 Tax=Plutella xylostella TaxID=51655 RepID=UPI002032B8F7|nr:bromodomain adjacent to zinc finger domain protein 1A [Plutella xylostella]